MPSDDTPVLLWGAPTDLPLAGVCTALHRLGTPMRFIDQSRVLETAFDLRVCSHGGVSVEGQVSVGDQHCDLARVRSVYARPGSSQGFDSVARAGPGSGAWQHAAAVDDALSTWLELTPALVVNRLSAMASNGSKPYQAALIRRAGFRVPDTLVTNDLTALRSFQAQHGSVIYKSASGVRSIVSRLAPEHEERLANLATCPVQFQEYVAGRDHRVHVVGDEVFGHEVVSDADDYRYASRTGQRTEVRPWPVPNDLAPRLRALARSLGLVMAGIDLRRTSGEAGGNEWVCFEVNPSPGFSFFEPEGEQPIAEATARLLSRRQWTHAHHLYPSAV